MGQIYACALKSGNILCRYREDQTVPNYITDRINYIDKSFEYKPMKTDSLHALLMYIDSYVDVHEVSEKLQSHEGKVVGRRAMRTQTLRMALMFAK